MSTDAMRAAALKIVAAYDAYRHRGMAPAPGEYAGVVAAIEEARAALAQPVSAEPVAPIANVKVFGCYDAARVPLDVRGVYQLDGFTTGVYVDMPSGACAPISPPPTSAESDDGCGVNNDNVICPNCCSTFRAVPVNVQQLMLNAGFSPPFTTPPARAERVPLTDEQIDAVHDNLLPGPAFSRQQVRAFARAIERAHGIGEPK